MNTLSLGKKIKLLRKKIGMTQRELAEKIPTSFSTFRRWEKDNHAPDYQHLTRLAEILGTTIAYLSGETNLIVPVNTDTHSHEDSQDNYSVEKIPNMSYWGGVADNARNVAKYGNEADKADVYQMLKRALAFFTPATGAKSIVDIHHNEMKKTLILSN